MKKVLSVILSLSLAATQATSKCSALNVTDMLEHLPEETKVALTQYLSGKKNLTDMHRVIFVKNVAMKMRLHLII